MGIGKYNTQIIRARRSYSAEEIAELLGINKETVFSWIKKGLKVIDIESKPLLIMGSEIKIFLDERRTWNRIKLKYFEYFCVCCRKAVIPREGSEKIVPTGKKIGKNNLEQFKKIGLCKNCGRRITKFLRGGEEQDYSITRSLVQTSIFDN